MRLDVTASPELKAVILAMRVVDRTIQKQVRLQTKKMVTPEWKAAIAERADTKLEQRVMGVTAVAGVSNTNVRLQSANKGRALSGGLQPKVDWGGVEFGSNAHGKRITRKGRRYTRVMGTQFKPHNRRGYVFFPAAANIIPRIAALWVQTVVRTIGEALEGEKG